MAGAWLAKLPICLVTGGITVRIRLLKNPTTTRYATATLRALLPFGINFESLLTDGLSATAKKKEVVINVKGPLILPIAPAATNSPAAISAVLITTQGLISTSTI